MSVLSWLFGKRARPLDGVDVESSGLGRQEATRPVMGWPAAHPAQAVSNAQPGNRKGERMARRELLYSVVRGAMMRAGVLSASYKFKVLSLDARGRQFLVMVDLAREYGGETTRLAEIEAAIAQAAKSRYDIVVTAVYWRLNDHVAVGLPGTQNVRTSRPTPLEAAASQPAGLAATGVDPFEKTLPLRRDAAQAAEVAEAAMAASQPPPRAAGAATAPPLAPARPRSRFEAIEADEVAAFRRALAAGIARPGSPAAAAAAGATAAGSGAHAGGGAPAHASAVPAGVAATAMAAAASAHARGFDGAAVSGPQSYTLLTGFEDTEMPDSDRRMPALSGTQYGELN